MATSAVFEVHDKRHVASNGLGAGNGAGFGGAAVEALEVDAEADEALRLSGEGADFVGGEDQLRRVHGGSGGVRRAGDRLAWVQSYRR